MNDEITLVSPCGINCGDCAAHLSKDNPAMIKRLLYLGFKEDTLPCPGCRPLKGKCPVIGGSCETYECLEKQGFTFCYECEDFPCSKFNPTADKAAFAVQNTKVFNLCCIQKQGVTKWLENAADIKKKYFQGKLIYGSGPKLED